MSEQNRLRLNLYAIAILLVIGLLSLRLAQLQIVESKEYAGKTRQSSIQEEVRVAPRGLVFDRNGKLLVDNEPTYTMMITPKFFDKKKVPALAALLGKTPEEVLEKVKEAADYTPLRPSPVFKQVSYQVVTKVEELNYEYPGVDFIVEQKRRYFKPRAAHILGYIKEISKKQLEKLQPDGYRRGDNIGQTGLEKFYESQMRGTPGMNLVMKNAHGKVVDKYRGGQEDVEPISGYTFHTSIDAKVQALGERLFKNKRGAAVAIDPNNGEIIALISAPDYNPELLSGAVNKDVWVGLNRDLQKPLYNRATLSGNPPGSTFKPFMSLIALQDHAIDENSKIVCNGGWGTHKCMGVHGAMDVRNAIKNSCNTFFYTLMTRLDFSRWTNWAHEFGFGTKLPIDMVERAAGIIPDSAYYDRMYGGRKRWKTSNLVILGIGQGITVTPLQLANYVATVANGGTMYAPHFVRKMEGPGGKPEYPKLSPPHRLPIDPMYFPMVQEGMRRSAMEHTRNVVWNPDIKVGGKTGTAQAPGRGRKDHSWFIGFAPLEKPVIAVAALVENAGFGATAAAPIASLMMEQYITGSISREGLAAGVTGVVSQGFERKVDWTAGADTVIAILKQRKIAEQVNHPTDPKATTTKPAGNTPAPNTPAPNPRPTQPALPPPSPTPTAAQTAPHRR